MENSKKTNKNTEFRKILVDELEKNILKISIKKESMLDMLPQIIKKLDVKI